MTAILSPTKAGFSDSHETVYLTPAEAVMLLERNARNRPVTRAHVEKLKADMAENRWHYNGEPIKFSHDLRLLDGQHRLIALSEMPEGTIIKFLVVYGLEDLAQDTMDQGKVRGAADQIVMANLAETNAGKAIAAAARVYILHSNRWLFTEKRNRITNPQVVEWVRQNPEETKILTHLASYPNIRSVPMRTSVLMAALLQFYLIDAKDASKFTESLVTGENLPKNDPILVLIHRLMRIRTERFRTSDREFLAMLILSWNHFRKGTRITKLQMPKGGLTEDTFPVAR